MPDITMCNDIGCPRAQTCYRSPMSGTEPSQYLQSWFLSSPRKDDDSCVQYWEQFNRPLTRAKKKAA